MSSRLVATSAGARIEGWVSGEGPPVLLLHGGPGLSFTYVDDLAEQLAGHRVASYQQRGLVPSSAAGPYTVSDHVGDATAVLDELGWDRAYVVGHSWGGHLALHLATAAPDRVLGVLALDTLGAVGDGGGAEFGAELDRRTPPEERARAAELDARASQGLGTDEDVAELLRLLWPAYFGRRQDAPPMPSIELSLECYAQTCASMADVMARLEVALPDIRCPVGFLTGALSPMPQSASIDTAARIPGAWVDSVPGAGHFMWLDSPGCVQPALDRVRESVGG